MNKVRDYIMYPRYFIGFFATIALLILLIFLIIHSGGKPKTPVTARSLVSYANTDAQVSLTIVGPITANVNHHQIVVTVDRNNTKFEHITGYQGSVVAMQNFDNNVDSYTNFLAALSRAGFTRGSKNPALANDLGYCPTGDRYIFELKQDDQELQRYWSTNCGGAGNYLGSLPLTLTLFQAQVPNYSDVTSLIPL